MDLPAFCVFKQFSAQVGLFRLCACLSISIEVYDERHDNNGGGDDDAVEET